MTKKELLTEIFIKKNPLLLFGYKYNSYLECLLNAYGIFLSLHSKGVIKEYSDIIRMNNYLSEDVVKAIKDDKEYKEIESVALNLYNRNNMVKILEIICRHTGGLHIIPVYLIECAYDITITSKR